jgi:hypothetical protein
LPVGCKRKKTLWEATGLKTREESLLVIMKLPKKLDIQSQ